MLRPRATKLRSQRDINLWRIPLTLSCVASALFGVTIAFDVLKFAFDQIRQASSTTPAVLIRQLDVARRLAPQMTPAARLALADQLEAIREVAANLVSHDRRDVEAGYAAARAALALTGVSVAAATHWR